MKPLLEIKTVPISIQYNVTPARVEQKRATAELEINRDKKGLSIKSRPIRLNVDSFEARNTISPSPKTSVRQNAERGVQMGYEATAMFAQEGNMLVNIHLRDSEPLVEIARNRMGMNERMPESNIKYIPEKPINMNWVPGEIQVNFEMDKLDFDWQMFKEQFNFTPATIEFVVEQMPSVTITYVGDPIYVPPSANPNYEPAVDVFA